MARDVFENSEIARKLFETANDILGFDLAKICFDGPEEELKQTRVTQPAIYVHSVALMQLVAEKGKPVDMTAGHSLGEYSALYASKAFSFEDGLRLVKLRGELMQRAGEISPGTMAAIIGLQTDKLTQVCDDASSAGVVTIANLNSPGQLVISGSAAGVERAMELAKDAGAKRAIPLVVGGAFHSPLMEFAQAGLAEGLEEAAIQNAETPVYSNVTAEPVTSSGTIKELLLEQLTSPVRWIDIVESMVADGAATFYEIGPGAVLTGLLKRINRDVTCTPVNSLESIAAI